MILLAISAPAAPQCGMQKDPVRKRLLELIDEHDTNLKVVSLAIGRNHAYLHQFIHKGVPRKLPEEVRQALARHFGIEEVELVAAKGRTGVKATKRSQSGRRTLEPMIEFGGEEYIALPVFDVRAAAGAGTLNQDELALTRNFFRHQWLRSVTLAPASELAIIQVDGDSMWDTLHHGDHVLIDRTQNRFTRDGIYALEMGEGLQIKRVSIHPTTRLLTVKSDNDAYPKWPDINPDDVLFAGRAIWLGRQV
jgi:phage repressor protein C with HTH and peptisase S24 domain